jgi:HSP20 family protein
MRGFNPMAGMLAEAVEMLERADRLQRQFFRIGQASDVAVWEPPIDMYGDANDLGVVVALPGVAPDLCEVQLESTALIVRGWRPFGGARRSSASVLRLEIPYGRFERRIELPFGDYQIRSMQLEHGCLRVQLERLP